LHRPIGPNRRHGSPPVGRAQISRTQGIQAFKPSHLSDAKRNSGSFPAGGPVRGAGCRKMRPARDRVKRRRLLGPSVHNGRFASHRCRCSSSLQRRIPSHPRVFGWPPGRQRCLLGNSLEPNRASIAGFAAPTLTVALAAQLYGRRADPLLAPRPPACHLPGPPPTRWRSRSKNADRSTSFAKKFFPVDRHHHDLQLVGKPLGNNFLDQHRIGLQQPPPQIFIATPASAAAVTRNPVRPLRVRTGFFLAAPGSALLSIDFRLRRAAFPRPAAWLPCAPALPALLGFDLLLLQAAVCTAWNPIPPWPAARATCACASACFHVRETFCALRFQLRDFSTCFCLISRLRAQPFIFPALSAAILRVPAAYFFRQLQIAQQHFAHNDSVASQPRK